MGPYDEPPYQELIDLMLTPKESKGQEYTLNEFQFIKWSSSISNEGINKNLSEFIEKLPRFKHVSDDQIEDFDMLETRQAQKYYHKLLETEYVYKGEMLKGNI